MRYTASTIASLLMVFVAAAPTATASGGPDPIVSPPSITTPPITCHTDAVMACGGTADVVAFHNDETVLPATWWVREGGLSGPVVYWQCIGPSDEPGPDGYSGDPAMGPSQDGISGSTAPLSDFDTTPGTDYSVQAYRGCWAPCDPSTAVLCTPLSLFLIGQHEKCIHGA